MWEKFLYFYVTIGTYRYRKHVKNVEALEGLKGYLLLPNHVATVDPALINYVFWKSLKPRPVAQDPFPDLKLFKPLFKIVRAIRAPSFAHGVNKEKLYLLEGLYQEILESLDRGDNVLFWPSGRLKLQGEERIEGSSGIYELLKRRGKLDVILIRITGLWGSLFSNAPYGYMPSVLKQFLKSILIYVANLLFLIPRRDVKFDWEIVKLDISSFPTKRSLNKYLEEWYNLVPDPFKTVPYHFLFKTKPLELAKQPPLVQLNDPAILTDVLKMTESIIGLKPKPTDHLAYDHSMDSLQLFELLSNLQEKYEIERLLATEVTTPEHLAALIERTWIPKRIEYERGLNNSLFSRFFRKNIPCLDEIYGHVGLSYIGGKIWGYNKFIAQVPVRDIPLFIAGGLEAYCAAIACYQSGKNPQFLLPTELASFETIYTTKTTMFLWTHSHLDHKQGVLKYFPDNHPYYRWKWFEIPKSAEVVDFPLPEKIFVNSYFQRDPYLFVALTHHALKNKIKVVLPFAGSKSMVWSKQIESFL